MRNQSATLQSSSPSAECGALYEMPKMKGGERKVKRQKVLLSCLLCAILTLTVLLGAWTFSRISMAYQYATQIQAAAPVLSETSLTLTFYGDPEPARPTLNMFQYVTAKNIELRTATKDPQGNDININFKLATVKFEKLNEDNFKGLAGGLDAHVTVGDLFDILAKADNIDVDVLFWRYHDMPALNATGVLTGNVEINLSVQVLPLMGLSAAAYGYKGDKFTIKLCFIKPIDVNIENPSEGQKVNGDVQIQALIKHAPGIQVENVHCWTDNGWNAPMQYNEITGRWETTWPTYGFGGNGWTSIHVRADGVDRKPNAPEYRYPSEDRIGVQVDNPYVNSFHTKEGQWMYFDGLKIDLQHDSAMWTRHTGFNFYPWTGLTLTAPEQWWEGQIKFNSWRIDDEKGNTLFQSTDPTLTITEQTAALLINNGGNARELKCIYEQV